MSLRKNFEKFEEFGKYQTLQYLYICLPLYMVSMSILNYVFVAEEVNYRCRVPECEDANPNVEIPGWWPDPVNTKCFQPKLNITQFNNTLTCERTSFYKDHWEECTEWIYESENSIVAGLNLGCQSWLASFVGSAHNAGMIASMLLSGWIADKYGRKPTIIICAVSGVLGIIKIFLTNRYAYLAMEFIESFLSSGLYTVGVVLLIEVAGEKKRVLAGVIFSYATYAGEFTLAFAAMGLQYWKYIILVANAPSFFFICYGYLLRESTRWQMLRGKMSEAKDNLKYISRVNNLDISSQEIDEIKDEELRLIFNVEEQKEKESLQEIFHSKEIMKRLLVVCVCFFGAAFVFCGLLVHSVYLPGNKYTNFALACVTAFPADLLAYYTFNRFGRRITLQCGFISAAIFVLAQAYTPETLSWVKIVLFLCGKFSIAVCFTGTFTYSLELFPTSVRGGMVGCGNTVARVGSMLSPLTPLLSHYMEALPSILFSSTALLAGALLTLTPETKTLPLFDTVAQVDAYKTKMAASSL